MQNGHWILLSTTSSLFFVLHHTYTAVVHCISPLSFTNSQQPLNSPSTRYLSVPNPAQPAAMKALRSLSSTSRPDSPTSRSRSSSARNQEPAPPPPPKPTSTFAFTQINVTSFDRAEAFFERVFGWRFIGEPTSPVFLTAERGQADDLGVAAPRVAPPIAPPPDHRVNYFTPQTEAGQGYVAGGLYKFAADSKAGNYGGRPEGTGKGTEESKGNAKGLDGKARLPGVINYVAVDDIGDTLSLVEIAGGKAVGHPWKERDRMAKFALFEDPEGNVFGLIQYLT